jgi:asparagine synthase (glutamine-hydrolysing)
VNLWGQALEASTIVGVREAIRFRGRDEEGSWQSSWATLLHSRLRVIDLKTGHQPMEDIGGRYVIVFNGEIYNYRELRAEYEKLGARFRTASDTEVLLEGYRLKGSAVCKDLNGMFSFAIWDKQDRALFIARDRMGKKPLFWTRHAGLFCFASTLDAFRAIPGWAPKYSPQAIALYGCLGAFPRHTTVYANAEALPPATWALLRQGRSEPELQQYWHMDFHAKRPGRLEDLLEEYEELLTDAVRIRLRSDVPLALTFSGGVDSGTIATLCARKLHVPLQCYTIDYHTEEDQSEETLVARAAAQHLGLEWQYIHFDYHQRLLGELRETYSHFDQPCHQLGLVYSQRLYEAIKPFATVCLSGNGADELFTGYIGDEKIRLKGLVLDALSWTRPLLRYVPGVSPFLRLPLPQAFAEHLTMQARQAGGGVDPDLVASTIGAFIDEAVASGAESALDLKMFLALKYRAADSNYRIPDISGLAAQVEVRSPYLDYRMVEFAASVPDRYKIGRLFSPAANKYLPKRYYERHVPHGIAWSRKKGMGWNVRFDRSIAFDPAYKSAFVDAYGALDAIGIPSAHFREAWRGYLRDTYAGNPISMHASVMMNGFMLGMWLLGRSPDALPHGAR